MRAVAALVMLLAAVPFTARAGGPLVVTTDGSAVGWEAARPVPYETDQGGLGLLGNAEAVVLVESALATWADVPTATIDFAPAGTTALDVTAANFGPFLGVYGGATAPSGHNVVVFDADGTIFDTLFGVGTGVVGFAGPTFLSDGRTTVPIGDPVPPGSRIVEGLVFLNGKWIDGVNAPASGNHELPVARFQAALVHELGHFSGLDHTQIHGLYGPPASDSPARTGPVETMFPFLLDAAQATLERDDVVALSTLYPSAGFAATTGRIAGRVLASDGTPFSGANVVARNVADDTDAVSAVSGAMLAHAGEFTLAGLRPGASYSIGVEEIDAFHAGGSRVGPFSPPPPLPGPPEFWNGAAEGGDPARDDAAAWTPIVPVAGTTTGGIAVVLNRQRFSVTNVPLQPGSQPNAFAVADFDRDGIPDFATTQFGFVPGNVLRFHRGLGAGLFALPATIASFPGCAWIVAAELDAGVDHFLDLAVASASLNEVRVYRGDGAGGFGPARTLLDLPNGGPVLRGLVAGDVDGDPHPDLVTVVENADRSAEVYALRGSAGGDFTIVRTALPAGSTVPRGGLALGQLAGDGATDVVGVASTGGLSGPPALGLLIGNGAGTFTAAAVPLGTITNGVDPQALALGDLNEDGRLDVAVSDVFPVGGPNNWTRSFVALLLGDGTGRFVLGARYAVPEVVQTAIVAADLDGDGHLDLASTGAFFGAGSPGAKVTLGLGDGRGGIHTVNTVWGLAEFPTRLAAADFDGDGRTDLLVDDGESQPFGLAATPAYSVLLAVRPTTTTSTSTTTTTRATTTSTTASTTSTTLVLTPVADTYVEAGSQATWDHGRAVELEVDQSPVDLTYLKFDLRGVSGTVGRATLRLRCRNSSDDGGTIFVVADSGWTEGTKTGADSASAGGPGLTWAQVDTNRDGRIEGKDTSPFVPRFATAIAAIGRVSSGQTVRVDVTRAVQDGPGLYTLAIRNGSTDGASWASREATAADRPALLLEAGGAAATSTTTAPTSTTTSLPTTPSSSTTTSSRPTTTTTATSSTSTTTSPAAALLLGPAADTFLLAGSEASADHGRCSALQVDLSPWAVSYLRFDLSAVGGRVKKATLELACTNASADGGTVYPVADPSWSEGDRCGSGATGLTWNAVDCNRDGRIDAGDVTAGCRYAPDFVHPVVSLGRVSAGARIAVDVTSAFQQGARLYALAIRGGSTDGADYGSREGSQAPRLRLEVE